jgi:hypothetical protein
MTTPTPTTSDMLRTATSLKRAAELVARACAQHLFDHAPPDPLDGLPAHCLADVARALALILDSQVGPQESLRRLTAIDAGDVYAVADLVAETCGWDARIALRAARHAAQLHRDYVDLASIPETEEPR